MLKENKVVEGAKWMLEEVFSVFGRGPTEHCESEVENVK
jgi:hypothetical protein